MTERPKETEKEKQTKRNRIQEKHTESRGKFYNRSKKVDYL